MESTLPEIPFVRELAARHRVVLLGGIAVIAHGLTRQTKDYDIWLEPFADSTEWAEKLLAVCAVFPATRLWSLAGRCVLPTQEVASEIEANGVLRVEGFKLPVDVFRRPNGLVMEEFDRVWDRAQPLADGVRLPDELDLHQTKAETGRDHDFKDQSFLESRVKSRFRERLPVCEPDEAIRLMERYADPELLGYALESPHGQVRNYALNILREFEAEGDPYSRDILARWHTRHG
jgi:hypothetical protein